MSRVTRHEKATMGKCAESLLERKKAQKKIERQKRPKHNTLDKKVERGYNSKRKRLEPPLEPGKDGQFGFVYPSLLFYRDTRKKSSDTAQERIQLLPALFAFSNVRKEVR